MDGINFLQTLMKIKVLTIGEIYFKSLMLFGLFLSVLPNTSMIMVQKDLVFFTFAVMVQLDTKHSTIVIN
jgi:hypothetical protein